MMQLLRVEETRENRVSLSVDRIIPLGKVELIRPKLNEYLRGLDQFDPELESGFFFLRLRRGTD